MVDTLKIKFQFIKHLDKFHLHRKKQRKHLPPFLQTEKRSLHYSKPWQQQLAEEGSQVWISVLSPIYFMMWPKLNYNKGTGKTWVREERLLLEKRVRILGELNLFEGGGRSTLGTPG